MKTTKQIVLFILSSAFCILSAQNPIATYYGNGNYPTWTDNLKWENRINMKTFSFAGNGCADCASEFSKFEFARDLLYAQGGGVLYYSAGTYDFSEISNEVSDSISGRGLMLRSGVVILGETPTTNNNALAGTMALPTKFIFKHKTIKDISSIDKPIPTNWSILGCMASGSETLKDVKNIGIAWVEMDGGAIYFGGEYTWGNTWATSGGWYSSKAAKGVWKNRVADGTHPIDPFAGAVGNYVGAGSGRLVFGCVVKNSVIGNHNLIQYAREKYDTIKVSTYPYKFGARVGVYGSNVFVSNNYMPKPDKCFKYTQTTAISQQDKCNQAFGNHRTTLIYDYGKSFGIDVNKGFLNPFSNTMIGYLSENVVVSNNWVYNHGAKGFEISGNYFLVQNNKNERHVLIENDDVYGLGVNWELTLDGFYESQPGGNGCLSDNLSRAFDMAGKNGWIDYNIYSNTGSSPGNDGEGILWQAHGGMNSILSFAITNNTGGGYMAGYDVSQNGALWAWNSTSQIGNKKAGVMTDVAIVSNVGTISTTGTDFISTCPAGTPTPPADINVGLASDNAYATISWTDAASNEIGFRVERKIGNGAWQTLVIRPRKSIGIADNEQVWRDYNLPLNESFVYRVVAINCDNNEVGASAVSEQLLITKSITSTKQINATNVISISPNPVVNSFFIKGLDKNYTIDIYNTLGRKVKTTISACEVEISNLPKGAYYITINKNVISKSFKIIKQ